MTQTTSSLQTVIDEIKNLAPDITATFVFKKTGEILANSENTTPEQSQALIASLNSINAQSIGGLKSITIQDVNSQLNITAVKDNYLATASSRLANQKIVASLTQVVVPTVMRLALGDACTTKTEIPQTAECLENSVLPVVDKEPKIKPMSEYSAPINPFLPAASPMQVMVEKIGGLLVAADAVRIDGQIIAKWKSLFGDKQFTHVEVETLEGKSVTCKFKLQKEGKSNVKGVIQIPEKILQALQCDKGKLVIVKPVVPEMSQ